MSKKEWPKCEIDEDGNKFWRNEKEEYHRLDGPAIEFADGDKVWYKNGKRHREGGPAYECIKGAKIWYKEGKLHRENGPAREYPDGTKEWYINGHLHRECGPAIEWPDGDKSYYLNGEHVGEEDLPMNKKEEWPKCFVDSEGNKRWRNEKKEYHREDGPAIECNGCKEWYRNGVYHRIDGPAVEYPNGDKEWWINGNLHRENGPAIEYSEKKEYWLNDVQVGEEDLLINKENFTACGLMAAVKNGIEVLKNAGIIDSNGNLAEIYQDLPINKKEWPKCEINVYGGKEWRNESGYLHREDGPAIEYDNGNKEWWINGLLHRADGPAIEYADGDKEYYLHGMPVKEEDLLTNKWPKCIVDEYGDKYWYNEKGQLYREDGPAVEGSSGHKEWFINGERHRENGPAIEWANGTKEWFKNGVWFKIEEKRKSKLSRILSIIFE